MLLVKGCNNVSFVLWKYTRHLGEKLKKDLKIILKIIFNEKKKSKIEWNFKINNIKAIVLNPFPYISILRAGITISF